MPNWRRRWSHRLAESSIVAVGQQRTASKAQPPQPPAMSERVRRPGVVVSKRKRNCRSINARGTPDADAVTASLRFLPGWRLGFRCRMLINVYWAQFWWPLILGGPVLSLPPSISQWTGLLQTTSLWEVGGEEVGTRGAPTPPEPTLQDTT